jgi:hypothetical protein
MSTARVNGKVLHVALQMSAVYSPGSQTDCTLLVIGAALARCMPRQSLDEMHSTLYTAQNRAWLFFPFLQMQDPYKSYV